jgi:hypothetical protein
VEQAQDDVLFAGQHGWIRGGLDFAIALLLGVTVIAIGWGAYQAETKNKDENHYFNRSDETRATSNKVELQGDQEVATDEQLFLELSRDQAEGHVKATAFIYKYLATADFLAAVAWWERQPASSRPPSPFVEANPHYSNPAYDRADKLEKLAADYLNRAHTAEQRALDYTLVTVVLTVALFLFGLTTQIVLRNAKLVLLVLGVLILLGSIGRLIDLAVV